MNLNSAKMPGTSQDGAAMAPSGGLERLTQWRSMAFVATFVAMPKLILFVEIGQLRLSEWHTRMETFHGWRAKVEGRADRFGGFTECYMGGENLRLTRERLGLTFRQVEAASARIAHKYKNSSDKPTLGFRKQGSRSKYLSPLLAGCDLSLRFPRPALVVRHRVRAAGIWSGHLRTVQAFIGWQSSCRFDSHGCESWL